MTIANSILLADNAFGTIASGLTVSDTTLTFTTGHGARFPVVAAGQVLYLTLLNSTNVLEVVKVTAHASGTDTATMVRASNGTAAKTWSAGDRVEARLTSEVLRRLQDEAMRKTVLSTADSGATYTGSMDFVHYGYVTGLIYHLTAGTTNSGAAPTINLDSLGAVTVVLDGGGALAASQMPVNGLYAYDGTNFILLNPTVTVPSAASQAQMEAASSTTTYVSPGRTQYHPGVAKAWCYVTVSGGSPTLAANHNVASITDNGTGDFTVNFTTAFATANYATFGFGQADESAQGQASYKLGLARVASAQTTTSVRVAYGDNGSNIDPVNFSVTCFGDQA